MATDDTWFAFYASLEKAASDGALPVDVVERVRAKLDGEHDTWREAVKRAEGSAEASEEARASTQARLDVNIPMLDYVVERSGGWRKWGPQLEAAQAQPGDSDIDEAPEAQSQPEKVVLSAERRQEPPGGIAIVRSAERTSEDLALRFECEKTTSKNEGGVWYVQIWGSVHNHDQRRYRSVKVIFTARDSGGGFLGRGTAFLEPGDLADGDVGYIEGDFADNEGKKVALIEYQVTGRLDEE